MTRHKKWQCLAVSFKATRVAPEQRVAYINESDGELKEVETRYDSSLHFEFGSDSFFLFGKKLIV